MLGGSPVMQDWWVLKSWLVSWSKFGDLKPLAEVWDGHQVVYGDEPNKTWRRLKNWPTTQLGEYPLRSGRILPNFMSMNLWWGLLWAAQMQETIHCETDWVEGGMITLDKPKESLTLLNITHLKLTNLWRTTVMIAKGGKAYLVRSSQSIVSVSEPMTRGSGKGDKKAGHKSSQPSGT